jgi:hypothetical protein
MLKEERDHRATSKHLKDWINDMEKFNDNLKKKLHADLDIEINKYQDENFFKMDKKYDNIENLVSAINVKLETS